MGVIVLGRKYCGGSIWRIGKRWEDIIEMQKIDSHKNLTSL